LCELDLQLTFPGSRPAGKDIEDELGAIEDFHIESILKVAELRGIEVVVEDQQACSGSLPTGANFFDFAPPNQGCRIRGRRALQGGADDLSARTGREVLELQEHILGIRQAPFRAGTPRRRPTHQVRLLQGLRATNTLNPPERAAELPVQRQDAAAPRSRSRA